ncbi:helix-turn-helix domain-containing protein [Chitinophaga arvensicola]|uniref:Helix-turn-helix domain-containing protein n=1 Tax=Chitinophaga arvensicola TaxID=29529 RepID=A0A1I0Q4K7_9BACT|nr:helix-turn-helix domain-containing protein [Chitinophaga arvensicola]SEW21832.1 Helix-turn-helix domain-containing protein [Chitinophaga arvensicola]
MRKNITVYNPDTFTARFMQPRRELDHMLKADYDKFFIVRVEDMYRLVTQAVPASRSTNHSCLFITSGEASMKIGSESYTIHKGEMLFVPAGQVFSFREGEVNKGFLCNFHTDVLTGKYSNQDPLRDFDFLRIWGNPIVRLDKQTTQFVLHLFKRLLFDYTRNGLNNLEIIQPYLITLLCEVKALYQPLTGTHQVAAVNITNRFRELVFTTVKTRHLVTDYASLLNITPNHLNKTVKMLTGKSPARWIDEAIVLEAKVLLSQSDLSISEVAAEIGFEDASYFARIFRKYEGITPSDFRKMIEKS